MLISILLILLISTISIFLLCNQKKIDKFNILQILSLVYFAYTFISIVLPDGLIMSTAEDELLQVNKFYLYLRAFKAIIPVVLLIASFYQNKLFIIISKFIVLPLLILLIINYDNYIYYSTLPTGRGLNYIYWLSEPFKKFLITVPYKAAWFIIDISLALITTLYIILKVPCKIEKVSEVLLSLAITITLAIQFMPIYLPQLIFGGFSPFKIQTFNIVHLMWLLYISIKIFILYLMFNKSSIKTRRMVCTILSIGVLIQYNSMFSLTINVRRLPFQLCNIASYIIILTILLKNQKLYNFIFLVNLLGAGLALFIPDVNNEGIFEVWNMHYVYEHTNIVVVPIMLSLFKVFKPVNRQSLIDALKGFFIYFIIVLIVGLSFNYIATITNNDYFSVNYFFMFDIDKASSILPFLINTKKMSITIFNNYTIYPLLPLILFIGYSLLITLFYLPFGIYNHIKEKSGCYLNRKNITYQ